MNHFSTNALGRRPMGVLAMVLAFGGVMAVGSLAQAQQSWLINVADPMLGPAGSGLPQQTTVTVSASFDNTADFAFAAGEFDFLFSEGTPGVNWINNTLLAPVNLDPVPVGVAGMGQLSDVRPGQLHFPAATINADNANPIDVWQVTYVATDFSSERAINLSTLTNRFDVYLSNATATSETRATVVEGTASFTVTPEPASFVTLAVGGLMLAGRVRRKA